VDWRARGIGLRVGGHRGASASFPENTYASFEGAIAAGGLYTETDVRLSADGVMVLMHDPLLDRTTNGGGPVSAMTLAQLRELDAGSWFGEAFRGQRIPELSSFLPWIEARAPFGVALEVKAKGIGGTVAAAAWASPTRDNLCIYAFDSKEIEAAKAVAPDLTCVLLLHLTDDPAAVIRRIEACGADGADVPWQWGATALVAGMRERGMIIGGGSDEGGHAARELVEMGADVIDTDAPAALIAAVAALPGGAH
jgi:glycerophosphoryl diester phosphodiesterase